MAAFFVVILIVAAVFAITGFKIVNQAQVMIIERLGRFNRILHPGLQFIVPFIDTPRGIHSKKAVRTVTGETFSVYSVVEKIDLRESVFDFPRQNVITKDNVTISINALLYFQIVDPKSAVYEIENLPEAIEKLTQTTLRNVIGEMDLDTTFTSRDIINEKFMNRNERIKILEQKQIRNKLLAFFEIEQKKTRLNYITLPFSFKDLADYIAVNRSSMFREIKNLKDEGFINVKGKKITLLYK